MAIHLFVVLSVVIVAAVDENTSHFLGSAISLFVTLLVVVFVGSAMDDNSSRLILLIQRQWKTFLFL
jgi:hypothetical protein